MLGIDLGDVTALSATANSGTSISADVSEPCRHDQLERPGVGRVVEGDVAAGDERHVAEPRPAASG